MLKNISVTRFKNIANLELELDKLNVLIGSNNSGKSGVLQAIQFAVSVAQSAEVDGSSRWAHNARNTTLSHNQLIYSPLRDIEALAPNKVLTQRENSAIVIQFCDSSNHKAKVVVRRGKNKNLAVSIQGHDLGLDLQNIDRPFSIFVPGLAGIPAVEECRTAGIVTRAAAKGDANNVFRNVLWLLKNQPGWAIFLQDFNKIFPNSSIDVSFNPHQDEHINVTVTTNDSTLPVDASGTGCLQAIQILSYINMYKPKLLILDEPDSHLHPSNQRKLAKMLVDIAFERGIQIILATHSRHITDALREYGKFHWIRNGAVDDSNKIDFAEILLDIGALDSGEMLLSGRIKCVVLTEDSNPEPLVAILEASGFRMDEVDVWPYKGCTNIKTAKTLSDFIKRHSPTTTVLIHRDRDYHTDAELEKHVTGVQSFGAECFITKGNDCESYFINPVHINNIYEGISIEVATDIINEATLETREKSIDKFGNTRFEILKRVYEEENPNPTRNARECMEHYDNNPENYRHGKTVLGPLKSKIQSITHKNPRLFKPSNAVSDTSLLTLANRIWP